MVRIVALHPEPKDRNEFDRYYLEVHMPLVQRLPGVKKIRYGRVTGTPDGGTSPYYLVADVYFEDRQALEAALSSTEGQAAMADVPNFSSGPTIMFCESEDIAPFPTQ